MVSFLVVLFVTLLASCIGTLSGFGLSTIMLPTLTLFFPFSQAILLVSIIHWFYSAWNTVLFREGISWHLFAYFGIPGAFTSVLGALLVSGEPKYLTPFLGAFLIGYSFLLLVAPTFQLSYNRLTVMIGGSLSGFFAGLFGMRGVVRSIFLSAFNLPKIVYLGSSSVISFFVDSVRLLIYVRGGMNLESSLWWGLLLFVPISFIGSYIGRCLVYKVPTAYFRMIIALFLLLVGLRLIVF